jgi:cytosine/adenosine deaminase-related metal-dependent hydrolase
MDLIVRNARLDDRPGEQPLDIGVTGGRIVAIEPGLARASETYDAGGRLVCGGLIETHIHLDKSRIRPRLSSVPHLRRAPSSTAPISAAMSRSRLWSTGHRFDFSSTLERAG